MCILEYSYFIHIEGIHDNLLWQRICNYYDNLEVSKHRFSFLTNRSKTLNSLSDHFLFFIILPQKISASFNIFVILNFICSMFTVFPIIIKRNRLNRLLCYDTDILHYQRLSHFPVAWQRLVVYFSFYCNMLQDICNDPFFYGDHITQAKLCKNFYVSDFLCNFLNLSLNLKNLTQVQFHMSIIFITKKSKLT